MRWEKQLATEASLSWKALEGTLELLQEAEDSAVTLKVPSEEWYLAAMLCREAPLPFSTWEVDLTLPEGAWCVENDTHRV